MDQAGQYIIIDIETTGLDAQNDKIIEIAAVKLKRGLVMDEFSTLINPRQRIGGGITALTGIDDAMVEASPVFEEVLPQLRAFIGSALLVAHNAPFDSSFLKAHLPEREWVDSLTLAQIAFPLEKSYGLAQLAASLGISHEGAHRALGDARATAGLFIRSLKAIDALSSPVKAVLHELALKSALPLAQLMAERTAGQPEAAAFPILKGRSSGYLEEEREIDEEYRLDLEEITAYFSPEGYFEQRLEGFENRPQQIEMAQNVAQGLNDGACLLAEAGTGTGKSLAYLLPAALFALNSGYQVAVSTHTINLQEQLLHKDIPMLRRLLERELKAVVLKGRSNYLCLSQYKSYLRQGEEAHLFFLMRLTVWLAQSERGEVGELALNGRERWQWQLVSARKENCLAPFCPYGSGECLVQRSRRAAQNADIFILNHALLLADASLERGFLPEFPYLIVDEAHHLEKVAESQFSQAIDFYELLKYLTRLHRREKGRPSGLLQRVLKEARGCLDPQLMEEDLEEKIALLREKNDQVAEAGRGLFTHLKEGYGETAAQGGYFPATLRLDGALREEALWQEAEGKGKKLAEALQELARLLLRLWELLSAAQSRTEAPMEAKDQLKSLGSLLRNIAEALSALLEGDEEDVIWLEFAAANQYPSLRMAPLNLGESLYDGVFREKEAMLLTSATLTAEGESFAFFKQQTGLDLLEVPPRELVLSSPFYYQEQALLAVCSDMPDPSATSEIHCVAEISRGLLDLLSASQGRAVVLFTSHAQLKAVYHNLRQPLAQLGITLLAQGISGSPSHLLERLKNEENCCVLGANSFWEGIDVVGSALSLVAVVRLPFWPPNTPIMQARLEKMAAMGINSFRNYSLPQAIIRFKQGFGRLIRSGEDMGVFCVLDPRFFKKAYGRSFQKALPEMEMFMGASPQVGEKIRHWLA